MAKLLAVCVLMLCFYEAFGRMCYLCTSTKSLEDCDENKKIQTCLSGSDYCATLSLKYGETQSYARLCSTKALCDNASSSLKACEDAGGECSYDCCDSDLCNGGNAVPMVSIFLMLACALASLFR